MKKIEEKCSCVQKVIGSIQIGKTLSGQMSAVLSCFERMGNYEFGENQKKNIVQNAQRNS